MKRKTNHNQKKLPSRRTVLDMIRNEWPSKIETDDDWQNYQRLEAERKLAEEGSE